MKSLLFTGVIMFLGRRPYFERNIREPPEKCQLRGFR